MKLPAVHKISKKRRNLILILTALLLLIFAASYTVFIAPLLEKEEWVYKESVVERGTLTVGVTESGSLEYGITSVSYDLDLDITDDDDDDEDDDTVQRYLEIEEVYAAQGQRIQEGDALLKFTEDSVADVRRLLTNALAEAKADYSEAEAEYELSVLEAQTSYQSKQIAGEYAQSIYSFTSTSITNNIMALQAEIDHRSANISSLEEKITEASEDYAEALEEYNTAKAGYDEADVSNGYYFELMQSKYLNALNRYESAKTALEQAQKALQENAQQISTLQSELALSQAKRTIEKLDAEEEKQEALISSENAEITYQAKLESLKEELEETAEDKDKLEEQLQEFEAFVGEDGILYAEGAGIVTESSYKAGDVLDRQGILLSYAEPGNMTISVDVTQEDVVELTVGEQVEIEFTAYEGEIYAGTILSIDTTATAQNTNTVSYTVVIGVDGDTSLLYGGMVADITFVTQQKENVLYLSKKAIVEENGKTYVYTKTALGGMELTEVQTGLSNGSAVEILSGLEEGDTIYIVSRVSSESEVRDSELGTGNSEGISGSMEDLPEEMELPDGEGGMEFPGADGAGDMPGGGDISGGQPGGGLGGGMPGGRSGNQEGQR